MMYNGTGQELANITDNMMFEYMMCDLLSSYKYKGIDPQSPGMIDNGKDALYHDAEDSIVFAFSIQQGWKRKFDSDFASARSNNLVFNQFIFCTNQRAAPNERDKIKAVKAAEGVTVDFFDRDRIKTLLDTHYKKIREIYLHIQDNTNIRRKIRNLLFDPDSEVEQPLRWQMLQMIAPLDLVGLFRVIKDEDISKIVEEQDEYEVLNTFVDKFIKLRKVAGDIDRYFGSYAGSLIREAFGLHSPSLTRPERDFPQKISASTTPRSASLRKSVRIVSSKQVFPPGDEEEGETLHNLRIEVGRNSQPRVNREMHSPQGSD